MNKFEMNLLQISMFQDELIPLIVRVLKGNPNFNYYQGISLKLRNFQEKKHSGFHDICLTILLVCGIKDGLKICQKLTKNGPFNRYLLEKLEDSVLKDLDLMWVLKV